MKSEKTFTMAVAVTLLSSIAGIYLLVKTNGNILVSIATIMSILFYVYPWYAMASIQKNTEDDNELNYKIYEDIKKIKKEICHPETPAYKNTTGEQWQCKTCGTYNKSSSSSCKDCGSYK